MRRQGFVWLAATVAVLGASACFSDPTKSLRSGPSRLVIKEVKVTDGRTAQTVGTLQFASLAVGDTAFVSIQVQDAQGNYFSFTQPTLATRNAAVASMAAFTDSIAGSGGAAVPGNTLWKALIIATGTGTTAAVVTAGGVTDSVVVGVQ